jgi:hypothetical protein
VNKRLQLTKDTDWKWGRLETSNILWSTLKKLWTKFDQSELENESTKESFAWNVENLNQVLLFELEDIEKQEEVIEAWKSGLTKFRTTQSQNWWW